VTAVNDVFAGLEELPWPDLHHAYGPAVEVPGWARGLVDPDPVAREYALDAMYGAVHHQGDVYDCTIAVLPFLLRIAATAGLPGRVEVITLVASIGGADDDPGLLSDDDRDLPPDDDDDLGTLGYFFADANTVVADAHGLWIRLLDDPDPAVRQAAAQVLPACRSVVLASLTALMAVAAAEPDPEARIGYTSVVGALARQQHAPAAVEWLTGILAGPEPARHRTAALTELVRLDVPVPVDTAVDLIAHLYEDGSPPVQPAGFDTDTLIGSARVLRELADTDRRIPAASQLVSDVTDSYAARPADQQRLVTALLRSTDWECRFDTIGPASRLIDGWRGDYTDIVALTADQLTDPHTALRPRALSLLSHVGPLAAPAADALHACLDAGPREADSATLARQSPALVRWPNGTPTTGTVVAILATITDPRVLPTLAWMLDRDDMPEDVPHLITRFGTAATGLLPNLWRRLRRLSVTDNRRLSVIRALHTAGAAYADVVRELLALPESPFVATHIGNLGPAAAAATSRLEQWTRSTDLRLAAAAAIAVARVGGPAEPVTAFVSRSADADEHVRRSALTALAALGPAGAPSLGVARAALTEPDPTWWTPTRAADAIWQITADPETVLPVLRQAWTGNHHTRRDIATICTTIGRAAAPLRDLLTIESETARRHNTSANMSASSTVTDDENLQHLCRVALTATG
jgi:hypothetical protein